MELDQHDDNGSEHDWHVYDGVTEPASPSLFGQSVTFTATVAGQRSSGRLRHG